MELKDKILKALGLEKEVKMGYQAKLEDGTIITSSADSLEAAVDVSILTEDGTTVPLPVGEYKTEDGVGFSVTEEGKVAEIYEGEEEDEKKEDEKKEEAKKEEKEYEEESPAVEEVVEEAVAVIEDNTAAVAEAINEATPDEVTPEIAEKAAEAAVAVLAPAVEEEVSLDSQIAELTAILKGELNSVKAKLKKIEKTTGGDPVSTNKFSKNSKKKEFSKAAINGMNARDRFFYHLQERN